jgi:hypothetical protein
MNPVSNAVSERPANIDQTRDFEESPTHAPSVRKAPSEHSKSRRPKPANLEGTDRESASVRKGPKGKKRKPPKPPGYYWKNDAAGFQLRRSKDDDYVGRLSGQKWDEMKRHFKGAALTSEINKWANGKIEKKYGRIESAES